MGTRSQFLETMLDRIPEQGPLEQLRTRSDDDWSVALLDAWSTVLDILTFYQERIANEAYLRTATERRSVLELARTIGYELNPGVAAQTLLAFTVEEAKGAPRRANIPGGTRVQSASTPERDPQTFETTEDLDARAAWNAIKVRSTRPTNIHMGLDALYLEGSAPVVKPGDAVLLVGSRRFEYGGSEHWDQRFVVDVEPDPANDRTRVTLNRGLGSVHPVSFPAEHNPRAYVLRTRAALFGHNAPDWRGLPVETKVAYLSERTQDGDEWPDFEPYPEGTPIPKKPIIDLDAAYPGITAGSWIVLRTPEVGAKQTHYVELYRVEASSVTSRSDFGISGRVTRVILDTREHLRIFTRRDTHVLAGSEPLELTETPITDPVAGLRIELDGRFPDLPPERRVIVSGKRFRARVMELPEEGLEFVPDAGPPRPLTSDEVLEVLEPAHSEEVTWVLRTENDEDGTVKAEPGQIVYDPPHQRARVLVVDAPVEGLRMKMRGGGADQMLQPDARFRVVEPPRASELVWRLMDREGTAGTVRASPDLIVSEPAPPDDPLVTSEQGDGRLAEAATIDRVETRPDRSILWLQAPLEHAYDPASVRIHANVAVATHGQTVREVLGSGDATQPNQTFKLKRSPLTHIQAATSTGARSTLEVRVGKVLWDQVDSLHTAPADLQAFIVNIDDQDAPGVIFGDGSRGARLPTGANNVKATYRVGLGPEGNVEAEALTTLLSMPLGVKEVTNPLPARGGAARESLGAARSNAPLTVLTMDRVVSLRDFEDFARAFAGVGKARAAYLWNGQERLVHVTVAPDGGGGTELAPERSDQLKTAIGNARDPAQPLHIDGYDLVRFGATLNILADERYEREQVHEGVRQALAGAFSFEQRALFQPVTSTEVIAVAQDVEGVVAVDLDELRAPDQTGAEAPQMEALAQRIEIMRSMFGGILPPWFASGRVGLGALAGIVGPQVPEAEAQPELPEAMIEAEPPAFEDGLFSRGQLLLIDPTDLEIREMIP